MTSPRTVTAAALVGLPVGTRFTDGSILLAAGRAKSSKLVRVERENVPTFVAAWVPADETFEILDA